MLGSKLGQQIELDRVLFGFLNVPGDLGEDGQGVKLDGRFVMLGLEGCRHITGVRQFIGRLVKGQREGFDLLCRVCSHGNQGAGVDAPRQIQSDRDITDQLLSQPDLLQLILRANFAWDSISDEEKAIYAIWNLKETGFHEMCYHLRKQGALEESVYQSRLEYFLSLYTLPGRRAWWDEQAASFMIDPQFYAEITTKLNEHKGTAEDYLNQFPQYQSSENPIDHDP